MLTEQNTGPQPGLWNLDDMWCEDGSRCLKDQGTAENLGGGDCEVSYLKIPAGVQVSLIKLHGTWDDFCHHQSKQVFLTLKGSSRHCTWGHRRCMEKEKGYASWGFKDIGLKNACAFKFSLEPGYSCPAPKYFRLRNLRHWGRKCLDLFRVTEEVGVWDCHIWDNQLWFWSGKQLKNKERPDLCVTFDTLDPKNNVKLSPCGERPDPAQLIEKIPIASNIWQLKLGGQCLDWDFFSHSDVLAWPCHSDSNQQWKIE